MTLIHKDKLDPVNQSAISVLVVSEKVISRIVLSQIQTKTEAATRKNQFDSILGRGTDLAICIVRQVIEKSNKHLAAPHFIFIEFKAPSIHYAGKHCEK